MASNILAVYQSLFDAVRDLVDLTSLIKMASTVPGWERTDKRSLQINSRRLATTASTTSADVDFVVAKSRERQVSIGMISVHSCYLPLRLFVVAPSRGSS